MERDNNGHLVITCDTAYDPKPSAQFPAGKYMINSVTAGKFPRRKYYESHADMIEAIEKANPGRAFSWTPKEGR